MKILGEALRRMLSGALTERYPKIKYPAPKGFRGKITINEEKCTGCGACSRVCPPRAIQVASEEDHIAVRILQGKCILCGECVEACPFGAMSISEEYENTGDSPTKVMTEVRLKALRCQKCGKAFISQKMYEHVTSILGEDYRELAMLCPECREKLNAQLISTKILSLKL